ncbi:hypothetical protein CC2G_009677 [Coprinopsis cinerea AmutBmut pab1-1]|nr:hypothetical protein CC2G_009677 [Coprinopsis cinerea AmutBmut pab1-1]
MGKSGKGKKNHNGGGDSSRGGPPTRGRGGFRGGRGRGRGRGGGGGGPGAGFSRKGGMSHATSMLADDLYIMDRMFQGQGPSNQHYNNNSRTATPTRGRGGRGRGQPTYDSPYNSSPRGRGRGMGIGSPLSKAPAQRSNAQPSLSNLLNSTRPLLRPVIFVRSEHTRVLFAEEDEDEDGALIIEQKENIIVVDQDVSEDVNEQQYMTHAPTADKVFQVFSGEFDQGLHSHEDDDGDNEELEEIDFSDLSRLMDTSNTGKKTTKVKVKAMPDFEERQEQFTGVYVRPESQMDDQPSAVAETTTTITTTANMQPDTPTRDVTVELGQPHGATAAMEVTESTTVSTNVAGDVTVTTESVIVIQEAPPAAFPERASTSNDDVPAAAMAVDDPEPSEVKEAEQEAAVPLAPPSLISVTPGEPLAAPSAADKDVKEIDMNPAAELAPPSFIADTGTDPAPSFIIDTDPAPIDHLGIDVEIEKPRIRTPSPIAVDREDDDDDEVIVYVAPHPRKSAIGVDGKEVKEEGVEGVKKPSEVPAFTPYEGLGLGSIAAAAGYIPPTVASPPPKDISNFTFSFSTPSKSTQPSSSSSTARRLAVPPIATPRMQKAFTAKEKKLLKRLKQKEKRKGKGGKGGRVSFGMLGAMMQERELHEEYEFEDGCDKRWAERRRGGFGFGLGR